MLDAILLSWSLDPWVLAPPLFAAGLYLRGWRILRRRDPRRWRPGQLAAFLGGLAAIFLALASPIEPFAALLLQVHMLQHLLLMMAAPPLLWLGAPLFPLLRGLPAAIRMYWVGPLYRWPPLRWLCRGLTHPVPAGLLFAGAAWFWHVPAVYELALRSPPWHYLQHACFLGAGLLFWYPVIRPYPSRPRWSPWLLLPYLLFADVQNTVLSAVLTFSERVLYPYYEQVAGFGGASALDDQAAAGVLMWVPGSVAFLLPLFAIGVRLLFGAESAPRPHPGGRIALPLVETAQRPPRGFDLLRVPLLGYFLKWRPVRLLLQVPLLLLAVIVIVDGLRGPQVGAMNLAGVLPWIHWRGLLVVVLLAAGNFLCTACPFLLPRTLARRWWTPRWSWPRRLRNKWPAVLLLVLFLWGYEAFALWDRPAWTACIALGYFAAALLLDGLFRGAGFCKYVCPIGQFNFVGSLLSPLEVKALDPAVCAGCRTRDCIRGRPPHPPLSPAGGEGRVRGGIPGCELHLYLPRKAGNLDCTFCLDCVHACPHDNVGILAVTPTAELGCDPPRSGVGRFGRRPDLAALVLVLAFGAFANAAGMVEPVVQLRERLRGPMLFYLAALVLLPLLLIGLAAALSRWWGRLPLSVPATAVRFAYALVPLGFGMWAAHYGFHFLMSYDTVVPTTQRFLLDLGWGSLGSPQWLGACCRAVGDGLLRLEIICLDVGLLLSLHAGYRIARSLAPRLTSALRALAPWAVLLLVLFAFGVWIVLQPMQMRGTLAG